MCTTNANMTDTNATPTIRLERETCSRCGGCGHHSYCSAYGTRCFKCLGKGTLLSKRGAAANQYLLKLRSKTASELQVGDTVLHEGFGMQKSRWTKVTEVRPGERGLDGGCIIDGVTIPPELVVITPACKSATTGDTLFRVFLSQEHEVETLKQAIEYQNSLTKTGKPRKRA